MFANKLGHLRRCIHLAFAPQYAIALILSFAGASLASAATAPYAVVDCWTLDA
jgi:hypothetical protein